MWKIKKYFFLVFKRIQHYQTACQVQRLSCYLDRQSTSVINNSFSDPSNGFSGALRSMAQHSQSRWMQSTFANTINSSKTSFLKLLSSDDNRFDINSSANLFNALQIINSVVLSNKFQQTWARYFEKSIRYKTPHKKCNYFSGKLVANWENFLGTFCLFFFIQKVSFQSICISRKIEIHNARFMFKNVLRYRYKILIKKYI